MRDIIITTQIIIITVYLINIAEISVNIYMTVFINPNVYYEMSVNIIQVKCSYGQ